MSNSDDPPKPVRTLLGIESSFDPENPNEPRQVEIPKELESTLPMGSTSLRSALEATLAAGPAAAAASIAAAKANDPSTTTKMGSDAINAAAATPSSKGPLSFTAKGTPPSTHDIAEAIAKAAQAHAARTSAENIESPDPARKTTKPGTDPAIATPRSQSPSSNPAIAQRTSDPSIPRTSAQPVGMTTEPLGSGSNAAIAPRPGSNAAQPVPASNPAIARTPTPHSNPAQPVPGSTPHSNPAQPVPASNPAIARTPTPHSNPAQPIATSNPANPYGAAATTNPYGSPDPAIARTPTPGMPMGGPGAPTVGRTPTPGAPGELPPDSMFARQKQPTGPSPFAPNPDPRARPATGPNPAAFAPNIANDPTALNMQAPDLRGKPPTAPNPIAIATAQGYSTERAKPPTGPNPVAFDPFTGKPVDPNRPPTGPNPAVDPNRPPTGPNPAVDPAAFNAKPGTNPNAVAFDPFTGKPLDASGKPSGTDPTALNAPVAFDPFTGKPRPPTGPNPAVDPTAFNAKPGTNPKAVAFDPFTGRPVSGPNPVVDPTAFGAKPGANPNAAAHDPTAFGGKPGANPNAAAHDPTAFGAKPGSNPNAAAYDPTAFNAKPGTNPNAVAFDPFTGKPVTGSEPTAMAHKPGSGPIPKPGSGPTATPGSGPNRAPDAFGAKPGTNPNAIAYPNPTGVDPNAAFDPWTGKPTGETPRIRPPTNPNPAAAHAFPVAPNDATMMASPASQAGQLSPSPERPRVSTDPIKPIAETLREVAIENYEVKAEIARGGMGRILRAQDLRLHRQVAIKELVGDNAHFKARFERETLITARLQHPAIVPIYDAGRWPTGELFYTMKLVAGKPLEVLINSIGSMRERIALVPNMIAVAEALAYAHSNSVVHRDLKPANILIGDFGETIVIDWGLAKDLTTNDVAEPAGPFRSPAVGHAGATVAGSVMGTPAYMPVEQGRGLQVDARADVYAIGAVLYHVLSKRAPYEGPDGMSILQALLKEPPPPLTEIAPDVPRELATIVAKAMAREADNRYPTARELVEDLRRYQNGQMVGVHRYTSRELFKRWAKKHKGALTVASFAFVALVVIGVIAISRVVAANREAQHEAAVAVEQTEAATRALKRAEDSEARAKKSEQTAAEERDRQRFARERRVEFDHFAHTQRVAKCVECHPTDPKTFTALAGHPGHAECTGCHEANLMQGMSNDRKCAFCHIDRVAMTKDHVSLRACDAGSIRAIKASGGKVGPCFPHDLKAHRIDDGGKPLECTTCHALLADKTKWGSKSYKSLLDLDTNTIIGQGPGGGIDAMHKACSTGCHAHEGETGQGAGTPACSKCHPQRSAF